MSNDVINPFDEPRLLEAPVMRAAYSDRTAWIMSAMSELAYYPFEGNEAIAELAADLAAMSGVGAIKKRLEKLLVSGVGGGNEKTLREFLHVAGFELIATYNRADTQAFLAKRENEAGGGMLVLAFRGTEKKARDIHSDVDAVLTPLEGLEDKEKVHRGFLTAFNRVKDLIKADLEAHSGLPVYLTGHSLGGALAILATRLLAPESQGACYTFGGPRVGTAQVDDQIKTPIYRVVNAADLVPRVPPSFLVNILMILANLFHFTIVSRFLRRIKGYVHFGDMRYLSHVEPGEDNSFPGLALHSNPPFALRAVWVVRRWILTGGTAAVSDHAISLYRGKLRAHALLRSQIGKPVAQPQITESVDSSEEP